MATFQINILNETFSSSNSHEGRSLDDAVDKALRGALAIGTEEVVRGKNLFSAQVNISSANRLMRRFIVSVSASPLQLAD
jgi:hypothetical protein